MNTTTPSDLDPQLPVEPRLAIPANVVSELPDTVRAELAAMPIVEQHAFMLDFEKKSKSLAMAYLCSLIYCHYILLGRWAMSGFMLGSLFLAAALGSIWWMIDLVRMPGLVRDYNGRIAIEILRNLKVAARNPAPFAHS
jgi:hypothetical protein